MTAPATRSWSLYRLAGAFSLAPATERLLLRIRGEQQTLDRHQDTVRDGLSISRDDNSNWTICVTRLGPNLRKRMQ